LLERKVEVEVEVEVEVASPLSACRISADYLHCVTLCFNP
jgi:hypothetical protein